MATHVRSSLSRRQNPSSVIDICLSVYGIKYPPKLSRSISPHPRRDQRISAITTEMLYGLRVDKLAVHVMTLVALSSGVVTRRHGFLQIGVKVWPGFQSEKNCA